MSKTYEVCILNNPRNISLCINATEESKAQAQARALCELRKMLGNNDRLTVICVNEVRHVG